MEFDIKIYDDACDKREFYSYMGVVFAMRDVRTELPYLYNEPGRVWFLALNNNQLVGFCSLQNRKSYIEYLCDYIFRAYRNKGVYIKLRATRDEYNQSDKPVKITCKIGILDKIYLNLGFIEKKRFKKYVTLMSD